MKPGESVANFWRKKDAGLDDGLLLRLNYFVLHPKSLPKKQLRMANDESYLESSLSLV